MRPASARRRRSSATARRRPRRRRSSTRSSRCSATTRSRSRRSAPGSRSARASRRRRRRSTRRCTTSAASSRVSRSGACSACRASGPPTSWTIWLGDPDDMGRRAEQVAGRFQRLKLKLGARDGLDAERVRAVRAVTEVPLQVDVNEAWTLDEALEYLPQLAELGVQYCEQPLPAGDPGGAELKRALAGADLRRRGLPHARRRRRVRRDRARRSISSSRSRAGSARPCAWRTPRARSGSA